MSKLAASAFSLLALASTGCSKKDSAAEPAPASKSAVPAPATPAATAPAPAGGPVLATADGEKPGVKVEVLELKRTSGDTLTLRFAFVNGGTEQLGMGYEFADKAHEIKDYGSIGGVTLVDPVGKKKYFVARDTDNTCLCSTRLDHVKPGARLNVWAKFPAPPPEVEKISVVIPHFGPLDDIAISR